MSNEGNGQPVLYKVSFSGVLAEELKAQGELARSLGLGAAFAEALRTAVFRMRHDPWSFGELIFRFKQAQWSVHIRVIQPLVFEFAISEKAPAVYIRRAQLLL